MKSDLERETGSGYYAEDRQWWLINSLKRQIANLEKSLSEAGA
jgi:prefoldin subunit 5